MDIDQKAASEVIRSLEDQHRHYEQQLAALLAKPYLSEDEQLEEVRLKKIKLRIKDEIAARQSLGAQLHYA
ncbi:MULTISPECIES: YdcH family protein [Acidobacterium]|uniref:DUF465 domain-containing protein n=1 Tax=Acidobacterium capsulatum (strain ATCC 51196 / DSM 11244 / BCRC 80197 / JCM 7670 / NBRC 15755 / NCIMB 13165 / 161) TaxID=240015 RepID=C1F3M7_ACIC5|nr:MULTISPECIES: YdcH family protein [Acidobacterium]ACO31364.1 hypothetical protein ACP_1019 [Acidobacterium capsulatum ATCC 51196]HCT60251.1 DUF465 domain-containing protein [Acidobacterium sp.]